MFHQFLPEIEKHLLLLQKILPSNWQSRQSITHQSKHFSVTWINWMTWMDNLLKFPGDSIGLYWLLCYWCYHNLSYLFMLILVLKIRHYGKIKQYQHHFWKDSLSTATCLNTLTQTPPKYLLAPSLAPPSQAPIFFHSYAQGCWVFYFWSDNNSAQNLIIKHSVDADWLFISVWFDSLLCPWSVTFHSFMVPVSDESYCG